MSTFVDICIELNARSNNRSKLNVGGQFAPVNNWIFVKSDKWNIRSQWNICSKLDISITEWYRVNDH